MERNDRLKFRLSKYNNSIWAHFTVRGTSNANSSDEILNRWSNYFVIKLRAGVSTVNNRIDVVSQHRLKNDFKKKKNKLLLTVNG